MIFTCTFDATAWSYSASSSHIFVQVRINSSTVDTNRLSKESSLNIALTLRIEDLPCFPLSCHPARSSVSGLTEELRMRGCGDLTIKMVNSSKILRLSTIAEVAMRCKTTICRSSCSGRKSTFQAPRAAGYLTAGTQQTRSSTPDRAHAHIRTRRRPRGRAWPHEGSRCCLGRRSRRGGSKHCPAREMHGRNHPTPRQPSCTFRRELCMGLAWGGQLAMVATTPSTLRITSPG